MNLVGPIPTFTIHDIELDRGTGGLAISRIEALSSSPLRMAPGAHGYDFYQIAWGTRAQGTLWIDLDCYPVKPNISSHIPLLTGSLLSLRVGTSAVAGILAAVYVVFLSEDVQFKYKTFFGPGRPASSSAL